MMLGIKQGFLKVKSIIKKDGRKFVVCYCDCGSEKITRYDYFKEGKISCCGCSLWDHHVPNLKNKSLLELYSKNTKSLSQYCGTKIHNTWRSIVFNKKGKKIGYPKEWKDFMVFIDDVQDGYHQRLFMQRLDQSKPHSKNNFEWVEKSKIHSRESKVIIDFMGDCYTLQEASERFGIGIGAIKYRIGKGLPIDEVLKVNRSRPPKPVRSHSDMAKSQIRSKASKMISSYRFKDNSKGLICDLDIDFVVNEIFSKPCSYCGATDKIGCDRLDNSKGHQKENVVPSCYECNTIRKNIFSFDEMVKIGKFLRSEIYDKRN